MRKGAICWAVASVLIVSAGADSCGRWEEHPNQYMSCFAGDDSGTDTLQKKKDQCCTLGADCLGVTCTNLHDDCSVRNHKACEGGEFLSPSEDETTYVKVVDFTPAPPRSSCEGMMDVKKKCSDDGCKVLADNMRLRTCSEFCKENGLVCVGAWEEKDDSCEPEKSWLCDEPYLDSSKAAGVYTSDLLCECVPAADTPPPPVRPPPPPPTAELPHCHWTEHPNTYISCHAGGDVEETDMLRAQRKCEDLGDRCAGVTCEGLWDRCTVRNNEQCDENAFLQTSPGGETSYTKDCSGPTQVGSCADLTDVKMTCDDNPCKALVTNMRGKTCSQYCFHHGLRCVAAWEEENDSCRAQQTWLCDMPFTNSSKAPGVWTSDLICECMPPSSPPPVSMCTWTRYEHAFISCHAAGDTELGLLENRKQRCESLGDQCAGVTCEGAGDEMCTVRHHEACDAKQFLAPSENEHSYVKKCGGETGCSGFAKQCPGGNDKSCKGLVEWLEGATCEQYCSRSGMACTGAWQSTREQSCDVDFVGECARVLAENKAICECSYAGPTPAPTPPVTAPLSPDSLPRCRWSEHPHSYISCFASGEKEEGDLISRKLACEQMGKERCAGITCRGLFTECTVRHNQNCDTNEYLAFSEEETSYVLEDCGTSSGSGTCATMPDVVKRCSSDGCKALVTNMRGVSCTQYCQQAGLRCKSAAEEKDDSCDVYQEWLCDQPFLDSSKAKGVWTSDLICECEPTTVLVPAVTPLPASPPGLGCKWMQLRNTFIACEAQVSNNPERNRRQLQLDAAMQLCEDVHSACEGVTCEAGGLCTLRNSQACDEGKNNRYPTSPSGEVSYMKDCGQGAEQNGVCVFEKLTNAQKLCGTPCSVLAINLADRSCARYCEDQGLVCMSALVPVDDASRQCSGQRTLMCDESPPGDTAICNCDSKEAKSNQDQKKDDEVQKHQSTDLVCAWTEYEHVTLRCSEGTDMTFGDLIEREQACEKDPRCIGVTCEGLHARCTTRMRGNCPVPQTKQFRLSEDEHTYIKNCTPVPPGGNCHNLKNVKKACTDCAGGSQKVLAQGMRGKSCAQYCRDAGMECRNAWEEKDDSCEVDRPWICEEPYLSSSKIEGVWTDDLICECAPTVDTSNPPPPPSGSGGGGGGLSSAFKWLLGIGLIGLVGFFVVRARSYSQNRSYAGFQPVRPVALDDDEEEGLFGDDHEELPASQDGEQESLRIPAPPKEKSGPEL
eukprot:Hpha_TRINITY_DN15619_c1_g1::TRINITY_DN15619_c1_g1_i1::g.99369::m.99369